MATFHGQAPADVQDEQLVQSWRTALNFDDEPAAGAQPPLSEAEAETCRALAKKGCEPAAIATMVNADEASVRSALGEAGATVATAAPSAVAPASSITILHFNDVYNIEHGGKPSGGAARFVAAIRAQKEADPDALVFFSGDAFNPSIMSTMTAGLQMPPILNACGVHTALLGNHDFDLGLEQLSALLAACDFPWMLSNARLKSDGAPLGGGLVTRLFEHRGRTLGLVGLIEEEWLATLATIDVDDVAFEPPAARGAQLAAELRAAGAEAVIALTHMRQPNDERLARECVGADGACVFDVILAGHDHHYGVYEQNGAKIVKSGTDFRTLSALELAFAPRGGESPAAPPRRPRVGEVRRVDVTADAFGDGAADVARLVAGFTAQVDDRMRLPIGAADVALDARFAALRTRETNAGNLVADIIRETAGAECALLNAGTLRADRVLPAGRLRMRDLFDLLPMMDEIVVLGVTGARLLAALENGVSKWPQREGRFPQVAGIEFAFDPRAPPGARVARGSVRVAGAPLDAAREYRLALKEYIARGKDGCRRARSAGARGSGMKRRLPLPLSLSLARSGTTRSRRAPCCATPRTCPRCRRWSSTTSRSSSIWAAAARAPTR